MPGDPIVEFQINMTYRMNPVIVKVINGDTGTEKGLVFYDIIQCIPDPVGIKNKNTNKNENTDKKNSTRNLLHGVLSSANALATGAASAAICLIPFMSGGSFNRVSSMGVPEYCFD